MGLVWPANLAQDTWCLVFKLLTIHLDDHHVGGYESTILSVQNFLQTYGPAPIVIELEQTLYMVSLSFNYTKTNVKFQVPYGPINIKFV